VQKKSPARYGPWQGKWVGLLLRGSCIAAAAACRAGCWLGGVCLGAVSLGVPAAAFQAEAGAGDLLLHRSITLGAFCCRWIGKLLTKFELVIAFRTTVFVEWHGLILPPDALQVAWLFLYVFQYNNCLPDLSMP